MFSSPRNLQSTISQFELAVPRLQIRNSHFAIASSSGSPVASAPAIRLRRFLDGVWSNPRTLLLPRRRPRTADRLAKFAIRNSKFEMAGKGTFRSCSLRPKLPGDIRQPHLTVPTGGWSRLGIGPHTNSRPPWPLTPIFLCVVVSREGRMAPGSAGVSPHISNFEIRISKLPAPCLRFTVSPILRFTDSPVLRFLFPDRPAAPVLSGGSLGQMNADSYSNGGRFC